MANGLTRFDPFTDLGNFDLFRSLDKLYKDFRMVPSIGALDNEPRIKIDVTESDGAYSVKAEVPGVKKEDVKVMVENNNVTITAETKKESEEKQGETVVRRERYFGKQTRSFTLGCDIDESKAAAKYVDGVLELTLPKKPGGTTAKTLTIN